MQIQREWLNHEGGTKFYQAFLIADRITGRTVTVVHYGPVAGKSTWARPVLGGQVAVYEGREKYQQQINAKLRRGYAKQGPARSDSYETLPEFDKALTELFGAQRAQELLLSLGHTLSGSGAVREDDLPAGPALNPGDEGEDKDLNDFDALPDNCGTW